MTATSPPPNLPALASLRFLVAIAVFLAHGALEILFLNQMVGGIYLFGIMPIALSGVSYFFILSGFVLTWSHRESDTTIRFWRRRLFRIFPNHLVTYLVALGLMLGTGAAVGFTPALAQLFLVHSWVPDPEYYNNINSLNWSLSVEVFCYLLFPLLLGFARKIRPERLWYWAGAAVTVVLAAPVVAGSFLPNEPVHPLGDVSLVQFLSALNNPDQPADAWGHASLTQVWFVYHLPIIRAAEFFLGVLLARIILNSRWIGLRPLPAALLLGAFYVADVFVPYLYQLSAFTIVPMLLLLGSVAAADQHGRAGFLRARGLVWLGDLTYAFYLVHGSVLIYGHRAFGTVETEFGPEPKSWEIPGALAFLAGAFLVSLLLAWLLHNLVEKPAMRRWARPKPRPAPPPVHPEPETAEQRIAAEVRG
ncbi:Peptidoglycan/LPS O-acetylase OafA/YrhL, contains acyltransferase and SGNH-hydrolase domains [Micromonospora nigra]|uniref:Peptidoglycan/LPS O-acetylase OafA/YrhL, contains acyltransferase and SGNH-hydrolase domains n=1 Tax=Micromonospora nigra TaxID=145857 RepID=A0A1C6SG53_9ACTN|nr:acyltransferase [Micromonospora nigra]SCL28383.1 Peptidoglycan/LPS O-acetylase OafA/YrhL, contains acyltransferase and SGNH-hydrolase domains [Micromonospora nigra]